MQQGQKGPKTRTGQPPGPCWATAQPTGCLCPSESPTGGCTTLLLRHILRRRHHFSFLASTCSSHCLVSHSICRAGRSWLNTHLVKTLFGQCAMFRCVIPLGVEQQLDNTKAKKENRTKTSFNIAGTSRAGQRCSTRSYFPPWPNKVSPSFPSPQQGPKTGR